MRQYARRGHSNGLGWLLVLGCWLAACGPDARRVALPEVTEGDAPAGRQAMTTYGCGSCHTIPGVPGADATVGPPLTDFAYRQFIAGNLANTADNLVPWLRAPQEVEPGTAMPNLGVTPEDALNMAAYLAELK